MRHDDELGLVAPAAPAPGHMGAPRLRLHRGDAGLAHEALELALLSGVNLGAKHPNDHERAPSGLIDLACERHGVFTSMVTGTWLVMTS